MAGEQLSLLEELVVATPTDKGGSVGSNRYSFQQHWTLLHLLELHASGNDYVAIMEHHDDLIVLDSVVSPSKVYCYQVKSGDEKWTQSKLTKRAKGKKGMLRSVLGRIFANAIRFSGFVEIAAIVSTAPFDLEVHGQPSCVQRVRIKLAELTELELFKISTAMNNELGQAGPYGCETAIAFVVTEHPYKGHDFYSRGKVAEYLEKAGLGDISNGLLHRALTAEISRKTNVENPPPDLLELVKRKGFTRDEMQSMIHTVRGLHQAREAWDALKDNLSATGIDLGMRVRLQERTRRYEIDLLGQANGLIVAYRDRVAEAVAKIPHEAYDKGPLLPILNKLADTVPPPLGYDKDYARAAALVEIYGYFVKIQAADTKPSET